MAEAVEKIEPLTTSGPTDKTADRESLWFDLCPCFCKHIIDIFGEKYTLLRI